MKTFLPSPRTFSRRIGFAGELFLLFTVLLCFGKTLSAGTRPVTKYKDGNIKADEIAYAPGTKRPGAILLPAISYASPQTYYVNFTITPLTPTSSGVAVAGYSGTPLILGDNFSAPFGVAVDAAGNIYVADEGNNAVKEIPVGGGVSFTLGSGFKYPTGVAVDAAGNVYVADRGNNEVKKIPFGSGVPVLLGVGFNNPTGVAVDAAGNVYVGDRGNNEVKKIPVGGGAQILLGSGFSGPTGVAVDAAGNVYIADTGNNAIKELPIGGGTPITLGSGFSAPFGVAVDAPGNLFVADYSNNAVKEIPVGGGTPVSIGAGFSLPAGVAVDGSGNVYVADFNHNEVKEIKPVGGYYINALPGGLSFNNNTGVISGKASAASPATNYTVTAYNASGSSSAVVNIKVNTLTFSNKVVQPGNAPTFSYSSPQTYMAGTPITPLAPTGSGVAAYGYSSSPVTLGAGFTFSTPYGVAADAAGNVYVANSGNSKVYKIPVGGGTPVAIGTGFNAPAGVAVAANGNVYVADEGNNAVKVVLARGGTTVTLGSGFNSPSGVAVDAAGNVYVADQNNNAVKEIPANGGPTVSIGSGFSGPFSVAVDGMGNVYVADVTNHAVKKVPLAGGSFGAPVIIGSGYSLPYGVAVDGAGNVYVADPGKNAIEEIPAGGGALLTLGSGLGAPTGVAVSAAGDVYVANSSSNTINEIKQAGGYFINTALPAGLSFSNATGIISGEPTKGGPATNYTITAYNSSGSSSAVVTLQVNALTISYSSPQTYLAGTAITALGPTSSGVALPAYSNTPVTLGPGFVSPYGVAVDGLGNVYVADYDGNKVDEIPVGGGPPLTIGTGFSSPAGVAVDAAGNIYVADAGNNAVKEVPIGSSTPVVIGSGFSSPTGVAVDAAGNVYVADYGNKAVKKVPLTGGAFGPPVSIGSGFSLPSGVAVDGAGNVYVADKGNSAIMEVPLTGGSYGARLTLGSGFSISFSVAVDGTGNVYVADSGHNEVKEIPAGGDNIFSLGSGLNDPSGVAVDAAGNVYVGDTGNGAVKKIAPVGGFYLSGLPAGLNFNNSTGGISGIPTTYSPATNYTITAYNVYGSNAATVSIAVNLPPVPTLSYSSPQTYTAGAAIAPLAPASSGVAPQGYSNNLITVANLSTHPYGGGVDASGNLYIIDEGIGEVKEFPIGGGSPIIIDSSPGYPQGIAIDAAGNLYEADYQSVKKIAAGSTTPVTIASGFSELSGIAVDAADNIYITDYGNSTAYKIPAGSSAATPIGTGFNQPQGVAVDAAGNIYICDSGNNVVKIIPVKGGAPVVIASGFNLPDAIALDGAGNLFVADLGNKAVKEIPSGENTPLIVSSGFGSSGLVIDATGNLYADDFFNYVVYKIKPVGGYYVNALPAGLSFSNGTGVLSGTPTTVSPATNYTITAYNDISVSKSTTVNIKVTSTLSADALLSSIKLSPASTLTIVTGPSYANYTTTVAATTSSVTVTAIEQDLTATIKVNGVTTASGIASAPITLTDGSNVINIVSTAQDGVTTKTYTITATKPASANLSALKLSSGTLSPTFAAATTSYTVSETNATTSITVTPTAGDGAATIKVNGTTTASGTASAAIPLTVGKNTITTVVTDGAATQTYTVTVTRAPSIDALLSSIKLTPASTLTIVTGPSYANYTTTVAATTGSVTVTAIEQDATATIKVNGVTTASGTASAPITLTDGSNVINVVSTAQDGVTIKTYTITATKPASANLSALKLSSSTLSPTFAAATTSYTATETNATTSITVTPTASDGEATIKVNGTTTASGTASAAIPLTVGPNTITTVVADGAATQTYTITVTRAKSTDALLSSIKLSPASTLTIVTGPSYANYTTPVPNTTSSVTVTAIEQDATATIKVNGTTTASGTASAPIPLGVGSNTINIVSTAQDGVTIKTYTITATRATPGTNNPDEALSVTKPANNITIENDGITVHQGVSPNGDGINDYLTIDGITNYPDNRLMIIDRNGVMVYQTKGYDNSTRLFDGHSNINGKMQLPGTYFYTLDYAVNGETKHKTGFIILKY